MIIHLNGWPGVGKRTIGEILAPRLGARFIHNHLLHDVAIVCCGLGGPSRWALYEQVRRAAYEALAERPREEVFVMTNALCVGYPHEEEAWGHVVDLAARRSVRLIPVVLKADPAENERRIQSAERTGRKMVDPSLLRAFMEADRIQEPDVPELLVVDTTQLSPTTAAEKIHAHVLNLPTTSPVSRA